MLAEVETGIPIPPSDDPPPSDALEASDAPVGEEPWLVEELRPALESEVGARGRLGIIGVDVVAPAGSYQRRAPEQIDMADADDGVKETLPQYLDVTTMPYGQVSLVGFVGATVLGQGAVLTAGRTIVLESVRELLAYGLPLGGLDALDAGRTYRMTQEPVRAIDGKALLVGRMFYQNFGHWLIEGAAEIALLRDWIARERPKLVVAHQPSPKMRTLVAETIAACLPGMEVEVLARPEVEAWTFEELHYCTPLYEPPLFKLPRAIEALSDAMLTAEDARGIVPTRRIYVSRRKVASRRLVNEADLQGLCESHGFETVFPEDLPIGEQVRLFRSAEVVMGAKGAALTSVIFSDPASRVIVLSPGDNHDSFFWDLAALRGMPYSELFGPVTDTSKPRGHRDFRIDPDMLAAALARLLPGASLP